MTEILSDDEIHKAVWGKEGYDKNIAQAQIDKLKAQGWMSKDEINAWLEERGALYHSGYYFHNQYLDFPEYNLLRME